jgi:hypothetical protein
VEVESADEEGNDFTTTTTALDREGIINIEGKRQRTLSTLQKKKTVSVFFFSRSYFVLYSFFLCATFSAVRLPQIYNIFFHSAGHFLVLLPLSFFLSIMVSITQYSPHSLTSIHPRS